MISQCGLGPTIGKISNPNVAFQSYIRAFDRRCFDSNEINSGQLMPTLMCCYIKMPNVCMLFAMKPCCWCVVV